MSGVEIAYEVLEQSKIEFERIKPNYTADRSEEYWTGWALAYYQWENALSFAEIVHYIPMKEIQALYSPYHEMDIRQFVDKMNELYKAAKPETNLKLLQAESRFESAGAGGTIRCAGAHHPAVRAAARKHQQGAGGIPGHAVSDVVLRYWQLD